jgi:xanthine dehydrogenase accessory factor
MPSTLQHLLELERRLAPDRGGAPAVLVTVARLRGSGPREEGAWMAVWPDAVVNTLGGGRLEFEAITLARQLGAPADARAGLHENEGPPQAMPLVRRFPLGPRLGQCCGGVVDLRFEPIGWPLPPALRARLEPARPDVALFGAGHVGRALAAVVASLPLTLRWIDSRDDAFAEGVPPGVAWEHSAPPQSAVADLAPGTRVLVMTHSHAEDLDIVRACLQRQRERGDLPFIGLIGSATKRATFEHRLRARGFSDAELAHLTCPIGLAGVAGKQPEVIAVAVAAQLLQLIGPSG